MPKATCYNKALDLLSRRPHFRRELASKLFRRGYEEDEVEAALDRLEELRLIDDAQAARDFVESRTRREPVGRRRLLAELARRGAPEDAARGAVEALHPEDDLALAAEAAAAWQRRKAGKGKPEALARFLERRGFSRRAIVSVLQEMASDSGADSHDTDPHETGFEP